MKMELSENMYSVLFISLFKQVYEDACHDKKGDSFSSVNSPLDSSRVLALNTEIQDVIVENFDDRPVSTKEGLVNRKHKKSKLAPSTGSVKKKLK